MTKRNLETILAYVLVAVVIGGLFMTTGCGGSSAEAAPAQVQAAPAPTAASKVDDMSADAVEAVATTRDLNFPGEAPDTKCEGEVSTAKASFISITEAVAWHDHLKAQPALTCVQLVHIIPGLEVPTWWYIELLVIIE